MDIALALGGGGFKGVAHIGVIDRLESAGFTIKAIAGTSAGGLMGAAYAAGHSPLAILRAVQTLDPNTAFRRSSSDGPSFMGYSGLLETMKSMVGDKTFENLNLPFACTAVDLNSSREVYLREGKVIDAIAATMAVPGALPPFSAGSALLVDGGVLDPVPVGLARLLAPNLPIVAVALSPASEEWNNIPQVNILAGAPLPISLPAPVIQGFSRLRIAQALRIFSQSMEIGSLMMAELRLKIDKPDVILRPDVYQYSLFDLVDPLKLVEAGRLAVEEKMAELRRIVSWRGRIDRTFRLIRPVDEPKVLASLSSPKQDSPPESQEL